MNSENSCDGKIRELKMYIESQRLIITEFTLDMVAAVQENSLDEDNKKYVPDEVWDSYAEAEKTLKFLISQYKTSDGPFVYPLILKDGQKNVGYVQLCPIANNQWEIGYHVAKRYTGNGYASEALAAFLPVIADKVSLLEIYGISLAENRASLAVMRKCGFKTIFEGIGEYQGKDQNIVKMVWKRR